MIVIEECILTPIKHKTRFQLILMFARNKNFSIGKFLQYQCSVWRNHYFCSHLWSISQSLLVLRSYCFFTSFLEAGDGTLCVQKRERCLATFFNFLVTVCRDQVCYKVVHDSQPNHILDTGSTLVRQKTKNRMTTFSTQSSSASFFLSVVE